MHLAQFHDHPLLEVAGIEPASFDASTGLLRAHPVIKSRALCSPPAPAEGPSQLNVPDGPLTKPPGEPYWMTPVPDPQGWGRTDGLRLSGQCELRLGVCLLVQAL